jgi:spermidine/putrescine transport system ATP-binding protein
MMTTAHEKRHEERVICLEVRDVVKRFPGVVAVNHVDLEIEEGEIFSLLGPSGCGKTTLLRMVAGLENIDAGDILIQGQIVNTIPPYKRDCSIVFQQLALFPHMTVAENIAFGLEERRVSRQEIRQRVSDLLDLMGLNQMGNRRPNQLSGGQQQRVALARSLVLNPKILLLDEPLASLDRKLRKEMQVELRRVQREVGITFLYVTHDQKVALSLSDRIGVMKSGKVVQIGTPNEIYEAPRTEFVASFMGASNIFLGKVVSRGEGRIEFETEDGLRILAPDRNETEGTDIVGISVHPEVIGVIPEETAAAESDTEGENAFRGKIKEVFYQGDFTELTVVLDQTQKYVTLHLNRRVEHETQPDVDRDIIVHWSWRHSNILAE